VQRAESAHGAATSAAEENERSAAAQVRHDDGKVVPLVARLHAVAQMDEAQAEEANKYEECLACQ